ncbi:MAG: hypothetical protein WBQ44_08635 [Rhodococcus sp. (in: high G+C Gram-positive bacteria)]
MTDPIANPTTRWAELAAAAEAGSLSLDPAVARECDAACSAYLEKLTKHRTTASRLSTVEGYGDFESGKQLARLYASRMVGGENSMFNVLNGHIRVVQEMQAVFQKFFTHYEDAESVNASEIAATGPN